MFEERDIHGQILDVGLGKVEVVVAEFSDSLPYWVVAEGRTRKQRGEISVVVERLVLSAVLQGFPSPHLHQGGNYVKEFPRALAIMRWRTESHPKYDQPFWVLHASDGVVV